jgi:protein-S-isoprenylcysteine O-methyltransferase Ste14
MKLSYLIISISCIWCISEVALAVAKRSHSEPNNSRDKSSFKFLWITIACAITAGVILGSHQIGLISFFGPWLSITGIILIGLGLIIRWIAILTLKKYFTVDVAVQSDQRIIQTSIYKYIRHPSYSGSLLSFLGLGLSFSNWLTTLTIFIPVFLAFYYRILVEEKALVNALGLEYDNYRNKTKMLIPFLF